VIHGVIVREVTKIRIVILTMCRTDLKDINEQGSKLKRQENVHLDDRA
jgi:hypothetical protein